MTDLTDHLQTATYVVAEMRASVDEAASLLKGDLDEEQIQLYDLSIATAELCAAQSLLAESRIGGHLEQAAALHFAAEAATNTHAQLTIRSADIRLGSLPTIDPLLQFLSVDFVTELGNKFAEGGIPEPKLDDEKRIIRETFQNFAEDVVKSLAEEIHRQDKLVPDEILEPLKEMGCFGLSVPQQYGGLKPDDHEDSLGMVIVTEELSRGSLGAAGSLITRPEIMARAILEGGTEEQKQRWLPGIAAGDPLCAISVTEPNTGSDVASVALKADKVDGGYKLSGGKTWCTCAGMAGLILVLARSEEAPGHRGLSLFVVEKPAGQDEEIEVVQEGGGKMTGRAISTMGYRGMHSYEMFYDDFFVPDADLIGEEGGRGKGFYYTMRGFMGGRLQTAARASGLMRAAFESAVAYANERKVFNRSVASYPVSAAKIARMGSHILAAKAYTAEVAALMDEGEGATEASLVKLFACRSAEWVTREAVQLYGGMGYAEESDVSRFFVDARVLSIFEGAEETLAIRVVGKGLVEQTRN